jgi:hypothetical protein
VGAHAERALLRQPQRAGGEAERLREVGEQPLADALESGARGHGARGGEHDGRLAVDRLVLERSHRAR